jgi:hypothetical protein
LGFSVADTFSFTDPLTSAVTTVSFDIDGNPEGQKGSRATQATVRVLRNGDRYIDVLGAEGPKRTYACHWATYGPASTLSSYLAAEGLTSKVGVLTRQNGMPTKTVLLWNVEFSRVDWNGYTEGSITVEEVA